MHNKLLYRKSAGAWLEGLPVGTGRLAAMVLGTEETERISLNHECLWTGKNRSRENSKSVDKLAGVRQLLLAGKYEEGTITGNDAFAGGGGKKRSEIPCRVDPYQTAGDLYLEFNHADVHNYQRQLDLDTSLVQVSYQDTNQKKYLREYLAYLPDDLILARFSVSEGNFDCAIRLERASDPECKLVFSHDKSAIFMDGAINDGISFRVSVSIWHKEGTLNFNDKNQAELQGVKEVILSINIGTSTFGNDPVKECAEKKLTSFDWNEIVQSNSAEYNKHYNTFSFELPFDEPEISTDERIEALKKGGTDPALILLYFNFGRYLFFASSANAMLPPNLQGKWCEELNPPWCSDYHHDINLQMNHWIAETTGMQEYTESLLMYLERFVPHAKKAAKDIYGCKGVWFPIQTDAWGRSTPESYGWAVWIGAAAWLAQHVWWHYEYSQDMDYLGKRAYPFLKEVAAFYESYLIKDKDGTYQIVPSQSPENKFEGSGDMPVSLCVSSTMDIQLAWDLLTHAVKAAGLLNVDSEKQEKWQEITDNLPKMKTGSEGQLLEWNREFKECEPGHRHISHLFGLYPGEQIHPERSPELFSAAKKSLDIRLSHSGGHTGWSRAWTACCYARCGDGDKALEHLEHLITDFATNTLLDLHPPRIFQIDGNLGGAAAIIEMLFQSYYEELHFLPALPGAWPSGKVRGLRGRGGYNVNIEWDDNKLKKAEIISCRDGDCVVIDKNNEYEITDESGSTPEIKRENSKLIFQAEPGQVYLMKPEITD